MVDTRDVQILELLQENGRATASEISKIVQLSVPAVGERIKKLSEQGLIKHYSTVLDHKKVGLDLTAFVFIVSEHSDHYEAFVAKAAQSKSVLECHSIIGIGSHILKVRAENSQALEDLLYEIQNWPGVNRTQSNLVLSSYKETTAVDLKSLKPAG
ncbi:MAG: Lrp/AsnC family transcriptional regulator [Candidatus Marinimicrobia bacterium]|nr:Lrp/AsnC family transcriptional regulator [Candidatus Neomarinimicrobiota bacterium]